MKNRVLNVFLVVSLVVGFGLNLAIIKRAEAVPSSCSTSSTPPNGYTCSGYIQTISVTPNPASTTVTINAWIQGDVYRDYCGDIGSGHYYVASTFSVDPTTVYAIGAKGERVAGVLTPTDTPSNGTCDFATATTTDGQAYTYSATFTFDISGYTDGTYTFNIYSENNSSPPSTADSASIAVSHGGTIKVTSNNASANWSFTGPQNPCGTCSGTAQTYGSIATGTYQIAAGAVYGNTSSTTNNAVAFNFQPLFAKLFHIKTAQASSCNGTDTCTLTGGGEVDFNINYAAQTCTVNVTGQLNTNTNTATSLNYDLTGPTNNTGKTNSTTTQTYNVTADPSGSSYTLGLNSPPSVATINGYSSDLQGIYDNNGNFVSTASASQTCFPNQTITFYLRYITKPVLQVQ